MEAAVQAQCLPSLEPLGFGLSHPSETLYPTDPQDTTLYPSDPHAASLYPTDPQAFPGMNQENGLLHVSPPSPDVTSFSQSDATISLASTGTSLNGEEDEDECLVETQSICFSENPFLVANRRGKGRPPAERILSGPPVGYGRGGKLQPWMYNKTSSSDLPRTASPVRDGSYSPSIQPANVHYSSPGHTARDSSPSSTRPGAIQPAGRVWSTPSPATPDASSPNPFQHGPSPINSQTSPRGPSPVSHGDFPMNIKQAYKAFAAVPHAPATLEPPQDLYGGRNHVQQASSPETPSPGGPDTPEQRSFRDRQKYFEIDVKQTTPDKPKPRVSLVGADDLKKMREEEERRFEQRAREYLMDDEDDDDDDDLAHMKATGKVLLDGVEYRVEPLATTTRLPSTPGYNTTSPGYASTPPGYASTPTGYASTPPGYTSTSPGYTSTPPGYYSSSGASSVDGKGESQRNSLEDGFRLDQRPNSMTGLIPAYTGEPAVAPIRTAKAERRHQERLRLQSPELAAAPDQDLSPAEKRALEAEKRAMWRAARPSGLEEDVRQYEQDLARRLYQARVRASQSPSAPPSSADTQPRMKSLEQDALKAQMVIAKSKEGKKRGTLDQLTESPSPAPTPSPTPMEELIPRGVTSPGRLSVSSKKFDYRQFAAIPSSKPVYDIQSPDLVDEPCFIDDGTSSPAAVNPEEADVGPEEVSLYSNKRKLRQGRHSLEAAVPT